MYFDRPVGPRAIKDTQTQSLDKLTESVVIGGVVYQFTPEGSLAENNASKPDHFGSRSDQESWKIQTGHGP